MTTAQFKRLEELLVHQAQLLHELVYIGEHGIYDSVKREGLNCPECRLELHQTQAPRGAND